MAAGTREPTVPERPDESFPRGYPKTARWLTLLVISPVARCWVRNR